MWEATSEGDEAQQFQMHDCGTIAKTIEMPIEGILTESSPRQLGGVAN